MPALGNERRWEGFWGEIIGAGAKLISCAGRLFAVDQAVEEALELLVVVLLCDVGLGGFRLDRFLVLVCLGCIGVDSVLKGGLAWGFH